MKIDNKAFYEGVRDKVSCVHYRRGGNSCQMHFHRQIEIVYASKTPNSCSLNGEKINFTEGQILFIDSFDTHSYDDNNGETIVLIIPQKYLLRYDKFMENKTLKSNISTDMEFNKRMLDIINTIGKADPTEEYLYQSLIDYLLSGLIKQLGYVEKKSASDKEFSEKILNFIQENYKENITLDVIATKFGYSKTYFSHLFNSIFNRNLNDYLSIIRLEHTLNDLKTKNCSVTSAALENGFNSIQTFYRVYKKNKL